MNDDNDGFDLEKYKEDAAVTITREVFKIIDSERKVYGEEFCLELTYLFLANTIATMVHEAMTPGPMPASTPEDVETAVQIQYSTTRRAIQETVATAFQQAFLAKNPRSTTDFVCEIHQFGEPVNKLPA